jgi:hypothetical protein
VLQSVTTSNQNRAKLTKDVNNEQKTFSHLPDLFCIFNFILAGHGK